MLKVLIIDDDQDIRFGLNRVLTRCGHTVCEAESGDEGLDALANGTFDLIFCDLRFPIGLSGEETLKIVREQYPPVKVVMMSCAMGPTEEHSLKALGAADTVEKPFFKAQCIKTLEKLFPPNDLRVA